jgi:hypothetical protein
MRLWIGLEDSKENPTHVVCRTKTEAEQKIRKAIRERWEYLTEWGKNRRSELIANYMDESEVSDYDFGPRPRALQPNEVWHIDVPLTKDGIMKAMKDYADVAVQAAGGYDQ